MNDTVLFLVVLVTFLALMASAPNTFAAKQCDAKTSPATIRIGVLYRSDTTEGKQLVNGVESIIDEHDVRDDPSPVTVCSVRYPYPTEDRGYRDLKTIRDELAVDLVIGPTDSGVFAAALREEETFAQAGLPVVSPVVAANFAERSDWLFKTNADVRARTETIFNLIRRRGVGSVGVLYEGTAFGLSAEEAFRDFSRELDWYQAARYSNEADLAAAIDVLLDAKPAGIAILASRRDIRSVRNAIKAKNFGLNPYNPYLFTIIDVRSERISSLDFVSVGTVEEDETRKLTEATMQQVLAVLDNVKGTRRTNREWAIDVKDGLAGVLDLSPQGVTRVRHLFTWSDEGRVVDLGAVAEPGIFNRALQGPTVLVRRYGMLPVLNLLVVAGLVILLTRRDLQKWNDEINPDERTKRAMAKVTGFNVVIALIVFFFMIFTGLIEWSSLTGAIVVGFGYPALLKTTIGQSMAGVSISDIYDDYLRRLNDAVMLAMYHNRKAIVDFIAMTNSPARMRETLLKIYSYNSTKRKQELMQALDDDLDKATDSIERRLAYARRIFRTHEWRELVAAKFVPPIDKEDLVGPEEILQAAVEFCDQSKSITLNDLREKFEARVQERARKHPERAEADLDEVAKWLDHAQTEVGDMRCYLRWLFMQVRFRISKIVDFGYLPQDAISWSKDDWNQYASRATAAKKKEWASPGNVTETPD